MCPLFIVFMYTLILVYTNLKIKFDLFEQELFIDSFKSVVLSLHNVAYNKINQ